MPLQLLLQMLESVLNEKKDRTAHRRRKRREKTLRFQPAIQQIESKLSRFATKYKRSRAKQKKTGTRRLAAVLIAAPKLKNGCVERTKTTAESPNYFNVVPDHMLRRRRCLEARIEVEFVISAP